jgi:hypothetical protein
MLDFQGMAKSALGAGALVSTNNLFSVAYEGTLLNIGDANSYKTHYT